MANLGKLTVAALMERFAVAYRNARNARFTMGDVIVGLLGLNLTVPAIAKMLTEAYPDAKSDLGYVLNAINVSAMAAASRAFTADGGLASPDGRYVVTRDDMASLPLTLSEMTRVIEEATSKGGALRLKDIARAVEAVASGDEKARDKAIKRLRDAISDEPPVIDLKAMDDERARIAKQIKKLQERDAELVLAIEAAVAEKRAAQEAGVDEQPAVTAKPKGRLRERPQRQQQVSA